jgi:hypothetical protein
MSFFPRTVRDWNLLPPDIVELDTPEAFKARIVPLAARQSQHVYTFVVNF